MSHQYHVRPGNEADLPDALALITELAEYERAKDQVETTVEQMRRDGFGPQPVFQFFVAVEVHPPSSAETIVGIAMYFYSYSTWKGKCLYLEDLVVTERCRRKQLGRKLLDAVVRKAKEESCARVMWQVLDWNEPAIQFYKTIGAQFDATWVNCRLTRAELDKYAFLGEN